MPGTWESCHPLAGVEIHQINLLLQQEDNKKIHSLVLFRSETEVLPLKAKAPSVFSQWFKLLHLTESRLPKICLLDISGTVSSIQMPGHKNLTGITCNCGFQLYTFLV